MFFPQLALAGKSKKSIITRVRTACLQISSSALYRTLTTVCKSTIGLWAQRERQHIFFIIQEHMEGHGSAIYGSATFPYLPSNIILLLPLRGCRSFSTQTRKQSRVATFSNFQECAKSRELRSFSIFRNAQKARNRLEPGVELRCFNINTIHLVTHAYGWLLVERGCIMMGVSCPTGGISGALSDAIGGC